VFFVSGIKQKRDTITVGLSKGKKKMYFALYLALTTQSQIPVARNTY